MEETLMHKFLPYSQFEFSFLLSLCVYLFKNCPSQFLSHWELAKPVFYNEELGCLPYKNQNLTLSSLVGKFNFAVW